MRWLRAAAKSVGAQILLELDAMQAFVRRDGRHWVLHPQFMTEVDGAIRYVNRMPETSAAFVGWRLPLNATWAASKDKLVFKRAVSRMGMRVPEYTHDDDGKGMADVVVKRAVGSFGEQVHGPFRSTQERGLMLAEGEYYERFIPGTMLKIWYCGDRAVAVESDRITALTGDGFSSVRELIARRLADQVMVVPTSQEKLMARADQFLAYDGRGLDDVLRIGEEQRIEFRYGSDLGLAKNRSAADLATPTPEWQALVEAGPRFATLVPEEFRTLAIYTVDAVRDDDGTIWFLEMNANPVVHPLAYVQMLETLIQQPAP